MARKAAWIVAILLLLNTGVIGIYSGVREISDVRNRLQLSVTTGVLVYGILGLAAAVALVLRHRWSVPLSIAWGVVVTYVASAASLAYAPEDATIGGAIAGGLGAGLIGAFVAWCAHKVTRPATLQERLHPTSGEPR